MMIQKTILAAAFVCAFGISGYSDEVLYDGKDVGAKVKAKATKDPKDAKNMVGEIVNANKGGALRIYPKNMDWSKYKAVSFKLHAEGAKGAQIAITLGSNPIKHDKKKGENYYWYKFKIDWDGWKTVEIPFSKFRNARKPVGYNRITSMVFNCRGWGIKPTKTAKFLIDDIKLISK